MASDLKRRQVSLRAGLRGVTVDSRERGCGVRPIVARGEATELWCVGRPGDWRVSWNGILRCGHIWTCPVCSERLRLERLQKILGALEVLRGRWQMVTLTLRHAHSDRLAELLPVLSGAWRYARQRGTVQRLFRERVTASVRALEVTRGANGWHPHLHVLLRTEPWDDVSRETLFRGWFDGVIAVSRHGRFAPDRSHGVVWSAPLDASTDAKRAAYLAKLGVEIAGTGKQGRGGSLSSWQIASRAARGDRQAALWWGEYAAAVKGKRMIELDDRAARASARYSIDAPPPQPPAAAELIQVLREDLDALRASERLSPSVLYELQNALETSTDPHETYRAIWGELDELARGGYAVGHGEIQGNDGLPRTGRGCAGDSSISPGGTEAQALTP